MSTAQLLYLTVWLNGNMANLDQQSYSVLGLNVAFGRATISVCNQPPTSTQPGCPLVGRTLVYKWAHHAITIVKSWTLSAFYC